MRQVLKQDLILHIEGITGDLELLEEQVAWV
jgi:hypothetical protein